MKSCRHGVRFDSPAHDEYTYVPSFADASTAVCLPASHRPKYPLSLPPKEVFDA